MKTPPQPKPSPAKAGVKTAPPAKPDKKSAAAKEAGAKKSGGLMQWLSYRELFAQEMMIDDVIEADSDIKGRYQRLMNLILAQSLAVGILSGIMILSAPIMRPVNRYFTLSPDHEKQELVSLFTPNLTNRAILSWAATSVTEIMTIGFGDFDQRVRIQRKRFTARGWESFQKALIEQQVRHGFKSRQLVLTTVPSDVPVITAQGSDSEDGYQWQIEMPIIMTFITNNNVSKKSRAVVRLTIVRVPSSENVGGIAIKTWDLV